MAWNDYGYRGRRKLCGQKHRTEARKLGPGTDVRCGACHATRLIFGSENGRTFEECTACGGFRWLTTRTLEIP